MNEHEIKVINECKICSGTFNRLSNHVRRTHGIEYRDYLVKHVYADIVPLCGCGCGGESPFTKSHGESFKSFIHGHHRRGKIVTDDVKQKIGEKNSVRMKEFLAVNPDEVKKRVANMRSGITDDSERRRLENSTATLKTAESRERASENAKQLWIDEREKMNAARILGVQTFNRRRLNGDYSELGHGSEAWKEKISDSITQKYLDGGFQWSRGKHDSPKLIGGPAYYRSSWELRHMIEMDADRRVVSYEHEPFYLEYEWEGRMRKYLPDFTVRFSDGRLEMHEVGVGELKSSLSRNMAKQGAGQIWASKNSAVFRIVSF